MLSGGYRGLWEYAIEVRGGSPGRVKLPRGDIREGPFPFARLMERAGGRGLATATSPHFQSLVRTLNMGTRSGYRIDFIEYDRRPFFFAFRDS